MGVFEMTEVIYFGYLFLSTLLAYPLLKWKSQEPKTLDSLFSMVVINFIFFGLIPFSTLVMKFPPDRQERASSEYYESHKIWIWNK